MSAPVVWPRVASACPTHGSGSPKEGTKSWPVTVQNAVGCTPNAGRTRSSGTSPRCSRVPGSCRELAFRAARGCVTWTPAARVSEALQLSCRRVGTIPARHPTCRRRTGSGAASTACMAEVFSRATGGAAGARDLKPSLAGSGWWFQPLCRSDRRNAASLWAKSAGLLAAGRAAKTRRGVPGRGAPWRLRVFLGRVGRCDIIIISSGRHQRGLRATLVHHRLHRGPPINSVPTWSWAWECPDTRPLPRLWLVRGTVVAFFSPGCGKSMPLFCMATKGGASGGAPRR
jgi:hypothetical protein